MCCDEQPTKEVKVPHVAGWRVWYNDGTDYSSEQADWLNLPNDGVLIVMLYFDDGGRRVMSGADYYFRARGDVDYLYAQSSVGEAPEEIAKRYPGAVILRGKWADEPTMYKAQAEAMAS